MRFDHDPILPQQFPIIAKIIRDETWLEGQRRGEPVSPDDPIVRANVCSIIMSIGADLRAQLRRDSELIGAGVVCEPLDAA